MKTNTGLATWINLVAGLILSACSITPTPVKNAKGGAAYAWQLGGKGMLDYKPDGSMTHVYSNEKSFQHFTQAVTTVAAAGFALSYQKAAELTTRAQNANATKQAINASNNATKVATQVVEPVIVPAGSAVVYPVKP